MATLPASDVRHLAKLARLALTEAEITMFSRQLAEVIEYNMAVLAEADVIDVVATAQTTGLHNVWQEDEISPSLPVEIALSQAPKQSMQQFAVPAVLDGE